MGDFKHIDDPASGTPITVDSSGKLVVPDDPIIPFIEGDGTGRDIWKASSRVFDAAVDHVFGGKKKIHWFEIYAGEKALNEGKGDEAYGGWISDDTFDAIRRYRVAIKGPLTTPVGGGIRSLNVTLRQVLDLYVCYRPVYSLGEVPSPVRRPDLLNVAIFRENTEDVYAGIEWAEGSSAAKKLIAFLNDELCPSTPHTASKTIRHDSGIGIKPISVTGSKRLIRAAIQHAIEHPRTDGQQTSVTLMHKGNIMKFTEGFFRDVGYVVAREEFRNQTVSERESWILGNKERNPDLSVEDNARMIEPGFDHLSEADQTKVVGEVKLALDLWDTHGDGKWKDMVLVKDRIADSIFQQVLTRPSEYYVIACPNLNGDYISDACAAQVGGLGIAPGANMGDGMILAEATHGTAPKYADKDVINPSSLMLSGCIMFEYMGGGWEKVGAVIKEGIKKTIAQGRVTYDIHRLMAAEGKQATKVKCSEYADAIIENLRSLEL
ncbi:MAG: NADP-dependent isocitrate dehydrogenase [Planctomycetota bacterium]|nr:MAG: NADP-dependent isocitrate dehydrogenase [Planctomycetota bacterium]